MSSGKIYLGRAPGDLPEIPNKHKETWLTEPILIFVFMEVIPWIAAVIICFLALTVVAIGMSLLCKYFCLLYSRRLQFKRLKKQKRKVSPIENTFEDSSDELTSVPRKLKKAEKTTDSREEAESEENESVTSDEDAEYGILTGTKRKKKEDHLQHHHHRHHYHHRPSYPKAPDVRKHKARHVVAKIMRRVRDGVMGKRKKKKVDPKKESQDHRHHHHQSHDHNDHRHHEQRRHSRKSVKDEHSNL